MPHRAAQERGLRMPSIDWVYGYTYTYYTHLLNGVLGGSGNNPRGVAVPELNGIAVKVPRATRPAQCTINFIRRPRSVCEEIADVNAHHNE